MFNITPPPFGAFSEVIDWCPTGSAYICDPPVTDTDEDYAVWTSSTTLASALLEAEWQVTMDDPTYTIDQNGEVPFFTARKGKFNLIVFLHEEGFNAFERATEVAKHLNLTNKNDRVMLFQAVCGGRGRHLR